MSNYYNISGSGSSSSTSGTSREPLPPPTQPPLSVLSIVGLVLAFTCLWPVGLVLSIIGLVETKNGAKRGFGVAVAGVVVNMMFALFTVLVFVVGDDHEPAPVEASQVNEHSAHRLADELEAEVDNDPAR